MWSGLIDTEGFLKSHVETYCCRNVLKYVWIWKESMRGHHVIRNIVPKYTSYAIEKNLQCQEWVTSCRVIGQTVPIDTTPRIAGYCQCYKNNVFTWVELSEQKCSGCCRWLQRGALCPWLLPHSCWQKHPFWLRLLKRFAHGLLMRLEFSSVSGCWKNSVQKNKGNQSYS